MLWITIIPNHVIFIPAFRYTMVKKQTKIKHQNSEQAQICVLRRKSKLGRWNVRMKLEIQDVFFTVELLRIPLKTLLLYACYWGTGFKIACTAFAHQLWVWAHILIYVFQTISQRKNWSYIWSKSRTHECLVPSEAKSASKGSIWLLVNWASELTRTKLKGDYSLD